jgi:23S rRNA (guanosine2251-2'-O)-methyltransferase
MKLQIALVLHNVRSTHNVGSILRSADGFGVSKVYLTGYTPYPEQENDERLPHLRTKLNQQIHKTALGAEKNVSWQYEYDIKIAIDNLKTSGFLITALEQSKNAEHLNNYRAKQDIALIVGNEVKGIEQEVLDLADICIEIPMQGKKESFNVAIAASIAMYHLRNY